MIISLLVDVLSNTAATCPDLTDQKRVAIYLKNAIYKQLTMSNVPAE